MVKMKLDTLNFSKYGGVDNVSFYTDTCGTEHALYFHQERKLTSSNISFKSKLILLIEIR